MAKKPTPKKKPVSPALLAKLGASVRAGKAFPQTLPPVITPTPEPVVQTPTQQTFQEKPQRKPPNRTDKFQLVVRIPDELAEELRDGAYTARESQTDIVERAIKAELGILRSQFPQFIKAPPPKNTRKI
jgi:hypothetical protein